jgi:AbrB family looped-hinge helix DNA binding protein
MNILTLDQSGQIQLPESVRQEFGLTSASQLRLEVKGGQIILVPFVEPNNLVEPNNHAENEAMMVEPKVYYEGSVLVVEPQQDSDLDINQLIDDLREERIQEQMGL